jgi:hypothetical protein
MTTSQSTQTAPIPERTDIRPVEVPVQRPAPKPFTIKIQTGIPY